MRPSTMTVPPVMYSQQWSPTASTMATRARVAHGEALAGRAGDEQLAAGRAVEARVAGQHRGWPAGRLSTRSASFVGGPDHDAPPGHALADVVVGLADELELDAVGEERAEALAGGAVEDDVRGATRRQCAVLEAMAPASAAPMARSALRIG